MALENHSTSGNAAETILDRALSHARDGWLVFPLEGKEPACSGGVRAATRDEVEIRSLFASAGKVNGVGGSCEGKLVVDVDLREGNAASEWVEKEGLPETLTTRTGGGGLHLVYSLEEGAPRIKSGQNVLGEGIDIKTGRNSYVVLPGSKHPLTGAWYTTENAAYISPAPEGIVRRLSRGSNTGTPETTPEGGNTHEKALRAGYQHELRERVGRDDQGNYRQGGRNQNLYYLACEARRHGVVMDQDWLQVGLEIGLEREEIVKTLQSAADSEPTGDLAMEQEVVRRLRQLEADREARRRLKADTHGDLHATLPRYNLADLLNKDLGEVQYVVEGLWPEGGKVLLAAPPKAGKSTMVGNLIKSLADGVPFLGEYDVSAVERIALVDTELSERLLQSWLQDQEIENPQKIEIYQAVGRAAGFDLTDRQKLDYWIERLRGVDVLFVDVLSPILTSIGLDENSETGEILDALTTLKEEAGIGALMLVHHAGHQGDRARGDSRLMGWSDAKWVLQRRDPTNPHSQRKLQVSGRDAELEWTALAFDKETRRMTVDQHALAARLEETANQQLAKLEAEKEAWRQREADWNRDIQTLLDHQEKHPSWRCSRREVERLVGGKSARAGQLSRAFKDNELEFPEPAPRQLKSAPSKAG